MNQIVQALKNDLAKILQVKDSSILIKIYENSSSVFYTLEEFFNQYNPEEIGKGQCNLLFKVDCQGKCIITFQLKDMYNCSGIIVGSDLVISKGLKNKGIGRLITKLMMDFSNYYGYGVLQATDLTSNEYQIKIFEKLKWTRSLSFINPKTKNDLTIWLFKF